MAGLSRRFAEAGYTLPKYMLKARGRTLFAHAVGGFSAYFPSLPFLFVCRDVAGTPDFVRAQCAELGVREVRLAVLDRPTAGQAETVRLGLALAGVEEATPLTIFNIDTFRPGFRFPEEFPPDRVDGYLEVFRGEGANWSYVAPSPAGEWKVERTTEKVPISDLCCTGLYHFASAARFEDAYVGTYKTGAGTTATEEYVAPVYNRLIASGRDIRYRLIGRDEVIFCGVPEEYDAFRNSAPPAIAPGTPGSPR
jgi:hypothetical protein